jgi:hypothetical protein
MSFAWGDIVVELEAAEAAEIIQALRESATRTDRPASAARAALTAREKIERALRDHQAAVEAARMKRAQAGGQRGYQPREREATKRPVKRAPRRARPQ